jgi:hypothetical protein
MNCRSTKHWQAPLAVDNRSDNPCSSRSRLWEYDEISPGSLGGHVATARRCGRAGDDKTSCDQHQRGVMHNPQHLLPLLPSYIFLFLDRTDLS